MLMKSSEKVSNPKGKGPSAAFGVNTELPVKHLRKEWKIKMKLYNALVSITPTRVEFGSIRVIPQRVKISSSRREKTLNCLFIS